MHIILIEAEIHIPSALSLKDKRSVMKRLLNEIRRDYNVSAAEVDFLDDWNRSGIAIVAVGGMRSALERTERQMADLLDTHHTVQLAAMSSQWL